MPQDTQIFSGANESGSKDYLLPGNSEILVLAVNANFVDNGAGADWCPAVVMFSDSGHVISRAVNKDDPVTAGDDAEVSWFPGGLKGGGGATGLPSCACSFDIGTGFFAAGSHSLPVASFSTSAPAVFSNAGGGAPEIVIGQNGFYLVAANLNIDPQVEIQATILLDAVGSSPPGWGDTVVTLDADPTHPVLVGLLTGETFKSMTATDFIAIAFQTDADIANVASAGATITQLAKTRLI